MLWPLAEFTGLHPVHFAIIGVISRTSGLVTPPCGPCLPISCAIGEIEVHEALRDVAIVLLPMLPVVPVVVMLPEIIPALPELSMPRFVRARLGRPETGVHRPWPIPDTGSRGAFISRRSRTTPVRPADRITASKPQGDGKWFAT